MGNASGSEEQPGSTGPGLDRIRDYERRFLESERPSGEGARREPPLPPHDLCGLALSGGGIRSATFNLGLLQGLQQLGLLEVFDYLATVSGGGYIGGFWTAWRHHHPDDPKLFPEGERGARGARVREVRHLREFSNFLIPRLGLLSIDTGRVIVALLCAVLPALLAALALIILVLLLWWGLAQILFLEGPYGSYPLLFLVTFGGLIAFEWYLLGREARLEQSPPKLQASGDRKRISGRYYLGALVAAGLVLGLWAWRLEQEVLGGFSPAVACAGAAVALVLVQWLGSRFKKEPSQQGTEVPRREREPVIDRIIGRLVLLAALWTVITAFWVAGARLHQYLLAQRNEFGVSIGVGLLLALLTGFIRAQQLFGRRASAPVVSPSMLARVKAQLPQILAYATLSLIVLGMVLLLLFNPEEMSQSAWLGSCAAGAALVSLLTLFFFDANHMGLHAFYRSRIARAFLGAAHGQAPRRTEPHPEDDLRLDALRSTRSPFHLICCAANDLAAEDPMANLYRGADSAVLSSMGFSVGQANRFWQEDGEGGRVPTLAAAMTASGAAFNSHMGSISMRLGPAATFLMTAFNLRLGLWWSHPTRAPRSRSRRLLVGLPFYEELLGLSRARGRDVLLSDGGHFENLALYELVRRKCRFILASDCGMDSDASFDDLANAVRRVREDFGVEIRIDLSVLRPGPDGLSRQTIVAGEIEYPDGNSGILLVVKPALRGSEPPDILQYKASNAIFPHESTGDQFYDEAQWEAYRRLGENAALSAFRSLRRPLEQAGSRKAAQLFALAREEWLPIPAGYEQRFSRFVERVGSLDVLLHGPDSRKLFREIFKEITELDRNAKEQGDRQPRGRWRRSRRADIEEAAGGPERSGPPTTRELEDSLHIIRRALLFMEEVFIAERLGEHYNHPAYLGVINYFARWAYAPLFRMWWPLLKTQCSPRFSRFLEERFSLPGMEREDIGNLSTVSEGFAMACWTEQNGKRPRKELGERLISYELALPYGGKPRYHIQAAQLIVRTLVCQEGSIPPLDADDAGCTRVLAWQGDDFFVPPGLRGAGIDEDFLRLLTSHPHLRTYDFVEDETLLAVRLLVDLDASATRRKRWADDIQLYRARGFSEPPRDLYQWLSTRLEPELDESPSLPWSRGPERWQAYWLARRYTPREALPDSHERRAEASGPAAPTLH